MSAAGSGSAEAISIFNRDGAKIRTHTTPQE